jgi:PIN domain nuclease of toxin-antitoxin system
VSLLIDTHVFLWWRDGSPRLPERVGDRIREPDADIVVSIVCFWEIAVKRAIGKLQFLEDFEEVMIEETFRLLTVTYTHLRFLGGLPQHHRDPFDRLLIAQSLAERIPIVTADRTFARYGVSVVW